MLEMSSSNVEKLRNKHIGDKVQIKDLNPELLPDFSKYVRTPRYGFLTRIRQPMTSPHMPGEDTVQVTFLCIRHAPDGRGYVDVVHEISAAQTKQDWAEMHFMQPKPQPLTKALGGKKKRGSRT